MEKSTRRSPGFTKIVKISEALGVEVSALVGSELNAHEGGPSTISELFFNHTVEHNDEILTTSKKEILVELVETVLLLKWERSTIVSDIQQIAELISELKEL